MRSNKKRFGAGALALGLCLSVGLSASGIAQGKQVTSTATGGLVPDATGGGALATGEGLFTQRFNLGGKKLNKQQTFDVRLSMSAIGSVAGANGDLRATLISPGGEKVFIGLPGRQSFILEFNDRSGNSQYCSPFITIALDRLYATGVDPNTPGSGSFVGNIDNTSGLNSTFRGGNPKGTWTLNVYDTAPTGTNTLGNSRLLVKTTNRFAKEAGKKK